MKAQPLRERIRVVTRTAILDAAESVAAEAGVAGTSLQAIAEHAGIAVGTIYNYFPDKNDLFEALFSSRRAELVAAVDVATKGSKRAPFSTQLDTFVRAVLVHFDARRRYLAIALESEHTRAKLVRGADGTKRPAMQQLYARAEEIMRVGVREKAVRADCTDLLTAVLIATLKGVLVTCIAAERPLAPETARVVELFLHGATP